MAETVLNQQESRLSPSVGGPERQKSNLKRIVGIVLSIVMVGLSIYVYNLQNQSISTYSKTTDMSLSAVGHATANYWTYVGKYKVTKVKLDETTAKLEEVNRQLDQVTAELSTTKGMLTQTQGMLAQAQDENAKLKAELQGLGTLKSSENVQNIEELKDKIKVLNERDSLVSNQLNQLKEQLRAFQADFSNISEGRALIALFRSKISLVKGRMRQLKQEAYLTRIAAQKEKDRLATLNGNSGFVVRDGQLQNPDGSKKTFAIDVKNAQ